MIVHNFNIFIKTWGHWDMRTDQHGAYQICDDVLHKIISTLIFWRKLPHAYIKWELAIDKEFQKHDLSKKNKSFGVLILKNASYDWEYFYRHDKIPQPWKYMKHIWDIFMFPWIMPIFCSLNHNILNKRAKSLHHTPWSSLLQCGLHECKETKEMRFLGLTKKF